MVRIEAIRACRRRSSCSLFLFTAEVQAKFIMQPNAVRQVVSLLSSASRDIQQSVFDLLVNLSAFEYAVFAPTSRHNHRLNLRVGWVAC